MGFSLITYDELFEFHNQGIIKNIHPNQINAASIDVRLGKHIFTERPVYSGVVDLARKTMPAMDEYIIDPEDGYLLPPGKVVLASTMEEFNLPDDIAIEFKLKSSTGRSFLNHMLAGWGDPGWHGSNLTLEFKNDLNYNAHVLRHGMPIGQVVFWRGAKVPEEASYRTKGRYNNSKNTVQGKGV